MHNYWLGTKIWNITWFQDKMWSLIWEMLNSHSWRIPTKKSQCLLLKIQTYSSFLSFSAKLAMSSYRFQGNEGRSVQFEPCVKDKILYASSESHRPAFMTLEPIRWQLRSWELMSISNRWLCKLSGKQMSNMADILF